MAEGGPEKSGRRAIIKDIFAGRNPFTGKPYFRRVRQEVRRPEDPSNVPTMEELPPIEPNSGRPATFQEDFMDVVDEAERRDENS